MKLARQASALFVWAAISSRGLFAQGGGLPASPDSLQLRGVELRYMLPEPLFNAPPPPPPVVVYGPPPVYYYEPAPRIVIQNRPWYRSWYYDERDYRQDNWSGHRHYRHHRAHHDARECVNRPWFHRTSSSSLLLRWGAAIGHLAVLFRRIALQRPDGRLSTKRC